MVNAGQTLVDTSVLNQSPPAVVNAESVLLAGRYQLLHPLGGGGMGNVYLAEDQLLSRQVAIKTIRPELSANAEVCSRIKRECRLHAAIGTHPHIITLFDTFEENGHIYLVMEYCAGQTLAAHLAGTKGAVCIGVNDALSIVLQLLLALDAIHGAGIVHRDIKTANILVQLRDDGSLLAKLTDFGIARSALEDETTTRLTALDVQGPGTPTYMAPERIDPQSFGPVGPAADLYAVGVILYELLIGRPPFQGTMTEIFSAHLVHPPDLDALPGTLPPQFTRIVRQALAKQANQRFASARVFAEAVEDLLLALPSDGSVCRANDLPFNSLSGEQTLLATGSTQGDPERTALHPRLAQKRLPRRCGFFTRSSLQGAGVALILLLGMSLFLWHGQRGENVAPGGDEQHTATRQSAAPVEKKAALKKMPSPESSALATLETVRQQKSTESAIPSDRARTAPGGEWQVVEHHSRKLK